MFKISMAINVACGITEKTMTQLSEDSGIPKSTLSQVKNGKMNPSVNMLIKIADGFGMKVSRFCQCGEQEV